MTYFETSLFKDRLLVANLKLSYPHEVRRNPLLSRCILFIFHGNYIVKRPGFLVKPGMTQS